MARVPGLVTRIPSNRRSGELGPGPRRRVGRAAAEATHLPPSASPEAGQPQRVEPLRRVLAVPRAALGVEGQVSANPPRTGASLRYLLEKWPYPPSPWPRRTALALSMRAPFRRFGPVLPDRPRARPPLSRFAGPRPW